MKEKTNKMRKIDQKFTLLVVPCTWVIAGITAIILAVCKLDWMYYLIGVCTGLLNFGLMVKSNRKLVREAELFPEEASICAKRHVLKGYLLRMLVFVGIFLAIFFKEVYNNPEGMWNLVIAFGGYATIKVVVVIVYLIFRKKVSE